MKFLSFLVFLLLSFSLPDLAQPPFYQEIQNFKKQDSLHFPPKNEILFIGSSSFRKWTDVQSYFPGYPIINRGFGGSCLPDVIRYADDILFPYQPKQVVIYCGENDFAVSDSISGEIVFERFKTLFNLIRSRLPGENIVFVSIKPSPSRERLWPKMQEANLKIKRYLSHRQHAVFVDVYHLMFSPQGKIMQDIFLSDNLHMNAKGYAIWQKAIEPYLLK